MNWQQLRLEVLERDNYTCQGCKQSGSSLHIHHKIPRLKGGSNVLDNLITFCRKCHKTNEPTNKRIMNPTTILMRKYSRQKLSTLGQKHDTYDDIINMLIAFYEKNKK